MSNTFLTFYRDDLSELNYATMCIKEAMRIHCPVPFVGRETTKEFELEGVTLLPGTLIDVSIHLLHHNEDVLGADHMVGIHSKRHDT